MKEKTDLSFLWVIISLFMIFLAVRSARAQVNPGFNSHSFQYLNGVLTSSQLVTPQVSSAWNSIDPPRFYSMSVTTTATGFQVLLEGSLDNANWSTIATTNSALGMVSNTAPVPALYFRMRASAIAANSSITATAIGVW